MKPTSESHGGSSGPRRGALKVAGAYALLAGLWIAVSDLVVQATMGVEPALTTVEIAKGLAFVVVTATGLYFFVRRQLVAQRELVEGRLTDEQRFRALVENVEEVFMILDSEGRPLYRSPAFQRMLGYDSVDAATIRFLDLVHSADRSLVEKALGEILLQPYRSTRRLWIRLQAKNGSWRVCEAMATNLLEHPAVRGIVVNWRERAEPAPDGG